MTEVIEEKKIEKCKYCGHDKKLVIEILTYRVTMEEETGKIIDIELDRSLNPLYRICTKCKKLIEERSEYFV